MGQAFLPTSLLLVTSTSLISHRFTHPPHLLPPHGLGTYINKLVVPLLFSTSFWPGVAKDRAGRLQPPVIFSAVYLPRL